MTETRNITVLVLGGGPDRERSVSLQSAANVAEALRQAGYAVIERDILPEDTSALNETFDVVFPVLHGKFGEGGPLQRLLEERKLKFVGSGTRASRKAIDKYTSKQKAEAHGVPTPPFAHLGPSAPLPFDPPLVIKPLTEGSSFGVRICREPKEVAEARRDLHPHHPILLCEKFIAGEELTVGIVDRQPLPVLQIRPVAGFYDYQAKYDRDDTDYRFEIDLPDALLTQIQQHALTVFETLDCRHLSRVDFLVDAEHRPWFLEINTMPGFTGHSLLPMAARRAGIETPELVHRLVQLALNDK